MLPQIRNILFTLLGLTFLATVISILFWTGHGLFTNVEFMEELRGIHNDFPVFGHFVTIAVGLTAWVVGLGLIGAVVLYVIPLSCGLGEVLWLLLKGERLDTPGPNDTNGGGPQSCSE
ncbi:MAG: hypothetical protein AAF662_02770 [Pseudomonadota bacterium]